VNAMETAGLLVAAGLLAYLIVTLQFPERF
jgi:K+-transporting ATPase KdpF subunit